mgnify:CR=1 FL=1
MRDQKQKTQKAKIMLLGFVGVLCVIAYNYLISSNQLNLFLKPDKETLEKILADAQSLYSKLPINPSQFEKKYYANIDENLLTYSQYYKKKYGQFPNLVPGYWTVEWQSINLSGADENSRPFFRTSVPSTRLRPRS